MPIQYPTSQSLRLLQPQFLDSYWGCSGTIVSSTLLFRTKSFYSFFICWQIHTGRLHILWWVYFTLKKLIYCKYIFIKCFWSGSQLHGIRVGLKTIQEYTVQLLQMKHILFVGENTAGYRRHKNAPSNATENQTMPSWQEPVLHSSPGKGGSVIHGI